MANHQLKQKIMKRFIPTLWKYFLTQYLKVLFLSLFAFIVILLATKLQDFANFVSMGAPLSLVGLFILYQIPYIIQIAIPISCLIAAIYLFQRLSQNNAISSARASGISLFGLIAPIMLLSIVLSAITFRYVLDGSAQCHQASKKLEFELRKLHPLAILRNTKLIEQSGMNIEMKGSLDHDQEASHFTLAARYGSQGDIALIIAEKLRLKNDAVLGQNIALIAPTDSHDLNDFDHLMIENVHENEISFADLSLLTSTKRLRLGNDDLSFTLLLAKKNDLIKKLYEAELISKHVSFTKRQLAKCYSEMTRRITLALSVISFSLLGMSYGISIGRATKKRHLSLVSLTALFLVCYLGGKALETHILASCTLYLIPHAVIIFAAIKQLLRIQRGQV